MRDDGKTMEELEEELSRYRLKIQEFEASWYDRLKIREEMLMRSCLFKGINQAKHCLLTVHNHNEAIEGVMDALGRATRVDRIGIFENNICPASGGVTFSRRFKWAKDPGSSAAAKEICNVPYGQSGTTRWYDTLSKGEAICCHVRQLARAEQEMLDPEGLLSMLIIPILVGDKFWGFLSFENTENERTWPSVETSMLITMAAAIGGDLERKRWEEALMESERRFRLLTENSKDIITVIDCTGVVLYTSPAVERISGYGRQDIVGRNIFKYVHPDDVGRMKGALGQVVKISGSSQLMEVRFRHKDGSWRYLEGTGCNLIHEPSIGGIVINARDITERKEAEQVLDDEKELISVTLESIGEGVITVDIEDRVVLMNRAAKELTGWTQEEAASRPLKEVFHIMDERMHTFYDKPLDKVLNPRGRGDLGSRTILVDRNGVERIISDTGAPIMDGSDNTMGTVIAFRDITDKVSAEEELLKVSKIESIGTLAGGIAHDFNNILTIILGNLSLARMYIDSGKQEKVSNRLKDMEKASLQAKNLTQQLLTFARGGAPIIKTASIIELLKDTAGFALSGSNIWCKFHIPEGLWAVEIDEGQVSQVINNLVINAKQAMPEGGTINIGAENAEVGEIHGLPLTPGRYVKISIEDTGSGIPEEHLHRIFDPYFTTKPQGNGLGLATSYSIVKKHGGYITVQSRQGEGTIFFVYLPASPDKAPEEEKQEGSMRGRGRVLVMDDDRQVLDIAGKMLEHMGYEPEFAKDGPETLEMYREAQKSGHPFDVVIMDLTIRGGTGGRDTVRKLLDMDSDARIIVSSGYSNAPVMADYSQYGFMGVAAKPYRIEELSRVLQDVIKEGK